MNDLRIYQFIAEMRDIVAKAVGDGVPMTVIYLAMHDIQREIVKPSMEQAIKQQMEKSKDNTEAKPMGEPIVRVVE